MLMAQQAYKEIPVQQDLPVHKAPAEALPVQPAQQVLMAHKVLPEQQGQAD